MSRRRLPVLLAAAALVLLLLAPAEALARGGSGAAGFSGGGLGGGASRGGGLGGGFSSGGGHGFALFILFRLIVDLLLFGHGLGFLILLGLILGAWIYFVGAQRVADTVAAWRGRGRASARRTAERQRRVELAAAEAAEEDGAFDPERVRSAATRLFVDIQAAWSANDVLRLRRLVAPRLMQEWERRLGELSRQGLVNHVEVTRPPQVAYVGIGRGARAAPGGGPDRVVVRIDARIRDWVTDRYGREFNERGAATKTVRMREYWTLRRDADGWVLESIEQGAEGAHQLEERIVQTGWADEASLRDDALVEQAQSDAAALHGMSPAELISVPVAFDEEARARALDLSVQDGRFSPDVLEIAARRAVGAWAQAIDGETAPLLALASAEAADTLLHPAGPGTRLVLRGPRMERLAIVGLDALSVPATLTVEISITARRYLQDRATAAIVAGSDVRAGTFTDRWTFTLSGGETDPWQLAAVAQPSLSR